MNGLYALHAKSTDAVAAADWYVEHLGGRVIETRRAPNGDVHVSIDLAGVPILFTQHPDARQLPRAPEGVHLGLEHFGLVVDNLEGILASMEAAGVEVLAPISSGISGPPHKVAMVRGPDGIRQELVELTEQPIHH